MNTANKLQEQHTAGPQAIGFDYQFYYFMWLALDLKLGQKIGFEVKDDIHIDKEDGTTILFQAKHTVVQKENGNPQNLTTLDSDIWKTLSNWTDMIKSDANFLSKHSFCLVTNKGENNNKLIDALSLFRRDNDVDKVLDLLRDLRDKTKSAELKSYIRNVLSLAKKKAKLFLQKLSIETDTDDIIEKVKSKILERVFMIKEFVVPVFDSLSSNMNQAKYLDIKNKRKFEITYSEFWDQFGKCFIVNRERQPLPKRQFNINLPENLEEQVFIKQLIDIGEIDKASPQVIKYTTQMLQLVNHLSYWTENNLLLPVDMDEFKRNSIMIWVNEFRARYRHIERQIKSGISITDLETEIQSLGLDLLDQLRRQDLPVAGDSLGIELSNGHYYALSNTPELGWHFDWERKYKSS